MKKLSHLLMLSTMCVALGSPVMMPALAAKPVPARARPATKPAPPPPSAGVKSNPLLPPQIPVDGFYADLSLVAKLPQITPQGFEPLYSGADWQAFRDRFGVQADGVTRQKSSGQAEFAGELVKAAKAAMAHPAAATATAPASASAAASVPVTAPAAATVSSGLSRLLLLRAAAIGYRNKDGFPIADQAVAAYLASMDKTSAAQVGALWSMANVMARTSVTPKEDRIRYDGIAAKANMQLALILLQADQIQAADAITHQIAYHEGWLKNDPDTRAKIAQVRALVKQTGGMMDYLATQYEPALHNDPQALMAVYLYGRYVKGKPEIVSDLPGRIPGSPLAHLAGQLDAADRGDLSAAFSAAEMLRQAAASVPDAVIRERTLYGALKLYDTFLDAKQTEHDRVQRTLAQIAREGVVADGAKKGITIDPFAKPPAPPTRVNAPGANLAVLRLRYNDFGPQAVAHELIGYDWFQWNSQGPETGTDAISVIVYDGLTDQQVKQAFPISSKAKQDFRCVRAEDALRYLDKQVADVAAGGSGPGEAIARVLRATRDRIATAFPGAAARLAPASPPATVPSLAPNTSGPPQPQLASEEAIPFR